MKNSWCASIFKKFEFAVAINRFENLKKIEINDCGTQIVFIRCAMKMVALQKKIVRAVCSMCSFLRRPR